MEPFEAQDISFLDWSGVDDRERDEVLNTLYADSAIQLPWTVPEQPPPVHNSETEAPPIITTARPELPLQMQHVYLTHRGGFSQRYYYQDLSNHLKATSPAPYTLHFPMDPVIVYPHLPSNYPPHPFALAPVVAPNVPPATYAKDVVPAPAADARQYDAAPTQAPPVVAEVQPTQPQAPPVVAEAQPTQPQAPASPVVEAARPIETPPPPPVVEEGKPEGDEPVVDANCNDVTSNGVADVVQHNGDGEEEDMTKVEEKEEEKPTAATNQKGTWASLFSKKSANVNVQNGNDVNGRPSKAVKQITNANNINNNNGELCPIRHPRKALFIDPNCYRMGEFLLSYKIDGRTISLQPKGLINRSNYCYINSILQALLACPPVYNLLIGLSQQNTSSEKQKATPVIDGMCRFVKQFQLLPAGMRVNRRNDKNQKKEQGPAIDYDLPFEPFWIYKVLNGVRTDSFLVEGRQEDAEEFLGCILNGLNDEMLELMKLVKADLSVSNFDPQANEDEADKEWQVMGPRNKGSITRQFEFAKTPISNIFGGFLKSRIHRTGEHSTYNIQPFFTLQLNIEKVKTVREALEALVTRNQLEGFTSEKTNQEVEAWQQVTLEELPVILILHLKCFDFQLDGCTKIVKALEFPIDLKIDSKMLSSKPNTPKEKQYKLFAVVYHDGKEATKGHYVTDAFHVGYSSWIRYDDASVKAVQEEHVLKPQGTRVPYLLFYRRSDTIRSK